MLLEKDMSLLIARIYEKIILILIRSLSHLNKIVYERYFYVSENQLDSPPHVKKIKKHFVRGLEKYNFFSNSCFLDTVEPLKTATLKVAVRWQLVALFPK